MDFELSQEQNLLADGAARFLRETYEFTARQELAASALGYSKRNWAHYGEMGWLALPFAEAAGGLGGSAIDMGLIFGALGAGLALEPLLPAVVLGGAMVAALGDDTQRDAILPGVMDGRLKLALACSEANGGADLCWQETRAEASGAGFRLRGHKAVVRHAASADLLVVIARIAGAVDDTVGISAFLVPGDAPGLRRQDYRLVDGTPASDLWFEDVAADLLGPVGDAHGALEQVVRAACCALCAEAVGAMERLYEMTRDYVGMRQQFGRALADNQIIQHRLVDMRIAIEESRALTEMVTMELDAAAVGIALRIAMMKAKVGRAARFVGEQAVQLHGGIGMTDSYPVGHYYKRLMVLDASFGDFNHHLNIVAKNSGETP